MTPQLALPWALGLLAVLPAILWLHRRRQPARRILVPSLGPWRIFDQVPSPSRRQFAGGWLLIAHLLAGLGLAVGASGLRLTGPGGPLAIILDASLSMGAAGRWDEAREAVNRLAAGREGPISLIILDERPRVLVRRSAEAGALDAATRDLPAPSGPETSGAPDLAGALSQAASLVADGDIVVVSDGALDLPALGATGSEVARISLLRIGAAVDNWGIIAVRLSRFDGTPQLFVKMAGRAASAERRRLRITADGRLLTDVLLPLPTAGEHQILLPLVGAETVSRLTVSLAGQDALPADDVWVLDAPMAGRPVQLVGASARLTRMLAGWPDLRVLPTGPGRMFAAENLALSIIAGGAPLGPWPSGPILFIGGEGATDTAQPLVWRGDLPPWLPHPGLPGLWVRSQALAGAEAPMSLATAGDRSVASLRVRDGRRIVTLALDPDAPELSVSRSWPRLLRWSIDLAMSGHQEALGQPSDAFKADDARARETDLHRLGRGWTETAPATSRITWPAPWRLAAALALGALLADGLLRGRRPARRAGAVPPTTAGP